MAKKKTKSAAPIKIHDLCSKSDFDAFILNNRALFLDQTTHEFIWDSATEFPKSRYAKSIEEQKLRAKNKAEVFTPVHIVKDMIDMLQENGCSLEIGKTYLEITCGEAPFITTRYQTDTGEPIEVPNRVGFLDRKLALIQSPNHDVWLQTALLTLKDCYGYEYQKDSLSIARLNILLSVIENSRFNFPAENIPADWLAKASNIISWNIFRMNGLTDCVPETDIPALIKNWKTNTICKFEDCKKEE